MNDPEFDDFVQAVRKADLNHEADEALAGQAVPLTHTAAVTPKDWERVQDALRSHDDG